MKPKNFPGRKNTRRQEALARRFNEGAPAAELARITAKLNPNARAIRTKKDRRDRAKFRPA
jgi:hypothetical protein